MELLGIFVLEHASTFFWEIDETEHGIKEQRFYGPHTVALPSTVTILKGCHPEFAISACHFEQRTMELNCSSSCGTFVLQASANALGSISPILLTAICDRPFVNFCKACKTCNRSIRSKINSEICCGSMKYGDLESLISLHLLDLSLFTKKLSFAHIPLWASSEHLATHHCFLFPW